MKKMRFIKKNGQDNINVLLSQKNLIFNIKQICISSCRLQNICHYLPEKEKVPRQSQDFSYSIFLQLL